MKALLIDHIGIAVKSLNESIILFRDILGFEFCGTEIIEGQKVEAAFFKIKDTKIELLQPTSEESAIAKFIEKKGTGIHHIAIQIENIEKDLDELKAKGISFIDNKPREGAHGKKIAFINPSSTGKILFELCENSHIENKS
jgi:methylmalonyl-CoA/ethylmalonyl-CoA epimerase